MVSKKFQDTEEPKPLISISIIGHIDSGKSTLTADITTVPAKNYDSTPQAFEQIDNVLEEVNK